MGFLLKFDYKLLSIIVYVGFLTSCQKTYVSSSDLSQEIQKAQVPSNSVFISTAITSHPAPSYLGMERNGILRLGDDNCIYIEQPSGEWVLPILVGTYSSPLKLSEGYKFFINKQVELLYPNEIVDLNSKEFNENNLNWVTLPPQNQCKKMVKAHIYHHIAAISHGEIANPPAHEGIAQPNKLKIDPNKEIYIGVYNLSINSKTKVAHEKATLIVDKKCLYMQFSDGSKALPIFATPRTYWDDKKGVLRAKGKDWSTNQPYDFSTMLSSSDKIVSQRYFDEAHMIIPPNPSCKIELVRYIHDINSF